MYSVTHTFYNVAVTFSYSSFYVLLFVTQKYTRTYCLNISCISTMHVCVCVVYVYGKKWTAYEKHFNLIFSQKACFKTLDAAIKFKTIVIVCSAYKRDCKIVKCTCVLRHATKSKSTMCLSKCKRQYNLI